MSSRPGAVSAEELVKRSALEVGFSAVGIAAPSLPRLCDDIFSGWLAAGFHGEMHYLERNRRERLDPGRILPGARSIVCVALDYFLEEPRSKPPAGRFSIHATRGDYHSLVRRMLAELERRLREHFPGMRSVGCVDTKPLAERTMAVGAGLGWLGKNTCLVSPRFGSWVFLGELVTDIDLEGDRPVEGDCGDCTLCLDACPTGALIGDGTMDARKCISYLTIEKRGRIEPDLAARMGTHLFGCDICQEVCPYNSVAEPSSLMAEQPKSALVEIPLEELAAISERSFRELTRNSTIRRCGAEGMRRNASIALENSRSGRA